MTLPRTFIFVVTVALTTLAAVWESTSDSGRSGRDERILAAMRHIRMHNQGVASLRPLPKLVVGTRDSAGFHGYVSGRANPRLARAPASVGSSTKSFTAAIVLQLDQEGVLSIHDTLADPRWRQSIHWPNARNITIKMLLAHTSGVPDYTDSKAFERRLLDPSWDPTPREVVAFARRLPPYFAPGKGWHYSNTGYQLLGLVIEAATGHSYAYELQHRIFGPLGLKHTYLYGYQRGPAPQASYFLWCRGVPLPRPSSPARVKRAREAACRKSTRPTYRSMEHYYANDEHKIGWSDGGIVSTPPDMTRWISKLIGSNQVLDARHRAMMRRATPQSVRALANADQPAVRRHWKGYGLGLQVFRYGAGPASGHGGNVTGFSSNCIYLPGHGDNYAIELIAPLISADTAFDSSNRIAAAVTGR